MRVYCIAGPRISILSMCIRVFQGGNHTAPLVCFHTWLPTTSHFPSQAAALCSPPTPWRSARRCATAWPSWYVLACACMHNPCPLARPNVPGSLCASPTLQPPCASAGQGQGGVPGGPAAPQVPLQRQRLCAGDQVWLCVTEHRRTHVCMGCCHNRTQCCSSWVGSAGESHGRAWAWQAYMQVYLLLQQQTMPLPARSYTGPAEEGAAVTGGVPVAASGTEAPTGPRAAAGAPQAPSFDGVLTAGGGLPGSSGRTGTAGSAPSAAAAEAAVLQFVQGLCPGASVLDRDTGRLAFSVPG